MSLKTICFSKKLVGASILALLFTACGPANEGSDPKIVGGRNVTANDQGPERVSTVGLNGCTGTIIAKDLILTAAHCYQGAVRGGYVLFGTNFNGRDRQIIRIASAVVNPAYRGTNSTHNDIAMLKLEKDIPSGFKAVRLLPPSISLQRGDRVRQAGYGSNNQPNSFGTLRTVDSFFISQSNSGSIFVQNGRTAACSGDSGGPLFVMKNNEWFVAGVTSTAYMDSQRRCVGGNHYSSVVANRNLILQMAKQLTGRENPLEGAASTQPQPEDKGSDLPSGEAKFQLMSALTKAGATLSIRVKNISNRLVRDCVFTLSPVRSFRNYFDVTYDLKLRLSEAKNGQEFILRFNDNYEGIEGLGPIKSYSISKICQG